MLTTGARLVLFVSSYAPLLALFAILDSFGPGWPSIVCVTVAAISVLALAALWRAIGGSAGNYVSLTSARSRDTEVMAFFVSYVVPFAAAQDANVKTRWALLVFLVIIAALYVRASIFYVHPLLLLVGYHVFDATTEQGVPIIVITRQRHLPQRTRLWAVRIASGVALEKRQP